MKKAYSKPEIVFEDFSLSTNIAAGCEVFPEDNAQDCGVRIGKFYYFVEGVTGCINEVANGVHNEICYDIPNENNTVFMS